MREKTAGSSEWTDSDNSTQGNKEELQFCQQWPLKHMYLKIFLLQHETVIPVPCLFSSVCYSYCDCTVIHLEITFLLRKSHFFFTYSANCLSLLGSEYNELTEIIRTLLFPVQATKPSSLLAGKYSWGFNVGFTWVQIVEVQALSEHYGWTTVQLFSSKKKMPTATGDLPTEQGMPIISHVVILPSVWLLNQFYFSRDKCLS